MKASQFYLLKDIHLFLKDFHFDVKITNVDPNKFSNID